MSYILVYLLYCDSGVRGGEPSSSGGVTGTIFIVSGVRGGAPGGVRGPGGSADIGALSRGERLRSSRLKWLGAFSSGEKRKKHWKKNEYFETLWGGPHREKNKQIRKKQKTLEEQKKVEKPKQKKTEVLGIGEGKPRVSEYIFF